MYVSTFFLGDTHYITDNDLLKAGVTSSNERRKILDAFHMYEKERTVVGCEDSRASAPPMPVEEASAPVPDNIKALSSSECVVCLDMEVNYKLILLYSGVILFYFQCQIIFVPCGHLCCCCNCSVPIADCPLCRGKIERKITLVL